MAASTLALAACPQLEIKQTPESYFQDSGRYIRQRKLKNSRTNALLLEGFEAPKRVAALRASLDTPGRNASGEVCLRGGGLDSSSELLLSSANTVSLPFPFSCMVRYHQVRAATCWAMQPCLYPNTREARCSWAPSQIVKFHFLLLKGRLLQTREPGSSGGGREIVNARQSSACSRPTTGSRLCGCHEPSHRRHSQHGPETKVAFTQYT